MAEKIILIILIIWCVIHVLSGVVLWIGADRMGQMIAMANKQKDYRETKRAIILLNRGFMSEEDKVKTPEEIIDLLCNNIEGLHGLEVTLLAMIKDYGFSEYKKGWNRCIDVGYEDVVHKYDE